MVIITLSIMNLKLRKDNLMEIEEDGYQIRSVI